MFFVACEELCVILCVSYYIDYRFVQYFVIFYYLLTLWTSPPPSTSEEALSLICSAAGSDIISCDTPVRPDSTLLAVITSSTAPLRTEPVTNTPSTASFITSPDSTPDDDEDTALPTQLTPVIVMETAVSAKSRGSSDDISPDLQEKKPLLLHVIGAESDEEGADSERVRSRRLRGAHSPPPCLGGRALLQLKGLREAPPPGQVNIEGGGARTLWKAVFSGNRNEKKKKWGRSLPPGAEMTTDAANQRQGTGDDVIKKYIQIEWGHNDDIITVPPVSLDVRGGLTEESDLDSSTLLQRCSLTPTNNVRLKHTAALTRHLWHDVISDTQLTRQFQPILW